MDERVDYTDAYARIVQAVQAFGLTVNEAVSALVELEPMLLPCRLSVARRYLDVHWHLGWIAWKLPDCAIRCIPERWVLQWWAGGQEC